MMTSEQVKAHLVERGMKNPDFYNFVSVGPGIAVFGLRNFRGDLVGYQNYRPEAPRIHDNVKEARYFTRLPRGVLGYFGLETLVGFAKGDKAKMPVFLTEGVFKAAKLHSLGFSALSLQGTGAYKLKAGGWANLHSAQLRFMQRPYLAIGDLDKDGEKMVKTLGGFQSPKDLDEMTDDEVLELLYANT